MAKNNVVIQRQQASLRNLEVQVGQLANELRNRPLGKLPADTKMPKRGYGAMPSNRIERWERNTQ